MKSAKVNRVISSILGYSGGFLVGFPIGEVFAGSKNPNWQLARVGAAIIAVSVPFSIGANIKVKKAVKIYNGRVPVDRKQAGLLIDLGLASNGVFLTIRF